ncbi:hypothetical protein D3C80_1654080 [compost metagenome]
MDVDEVGFGELRVDRHQIALHLVEKRLVGLLEFGMLTGHVEGHVDYVMVQRPQIAVFH